MKKEFADQARLMLRILPLVNAEESFALKGGTALNFFIWDMPRLSVDIDLTYLPIQPREESLRGISSGLARIRQSIEKSFRDFKVHESRNDGFVFKLVVRTPTTAVKIEPNTVIRGALDGVVSRELSGKARNAFEVAVKARTLTEPALFGGKICAALDRQHPRDLFDVKHILEEPGLTETVRKEFLLHLISHNRPIHEVIDPTRKDVRAILEDEFKDMTEESVTYESLVEAREQLISQLKKVLTADDKRFLLSLSEGRPEWKLFGLEGAERLPAVQWKLKNIEKMAPAKRKQQLEDLRKKLGL